MTSDTDLDEPESLPEEIVHWQPNHRPPLAQAHLTTGTGGSVTGSALVGALAIGAVALGALAIGALAIGTLGIGRLSVRRARFQRLEVGDLVVRRLRVLERD